MHVYSIETQYVCIHIHVTCNVQCSFRAHKRGCFIDEFGFEVEERLYPATMMACTEKVVKGKLTVADMEQG